MFIVALILNLISSFLIASIFRQFLIIFVAFFALIVLNMEILSLFGAISDINAFIFTILNLIVSYLVFKFKKATLLKVDFDFNRFKNSLLLDKSLVVLSIAFVTLLSVSLFLSLVMPVLEPDSQTYHFLRAFEFVKNSSLNHFEINDIRALIMPINSEIIYSWMLLFKKNFHGYGIVSYCAFLFVICSMWNIFDKFKFAFRKRLYAIFLFSSFSAVIIQMPSLQTDLLVGSLLICAFALFIRNSYYFSALSLALAMGTKSTGVVALIPFLILIVLYKKMIDKNNELDKLRNFFLFLFINFLFFSSYNYFLNFIHFGNPFSNRAAYLGHRFWGGFEGYISNLLHFFFQSFDFTGFKWGYYLNNQILQIKQNVFELINVNPRIGCNVPQEIVNIFTDEQTVGFGVLGFLIFLPMVFISLFKVVKNKNQKNILLFIVAFVFLLNILLMARATAYMVFSIRFIVAFVCLSSVILIGVYKKRGFLRPIILFFCLFYMFLIPFHNKRMPFAVVAKAFSNSKFNLAEFEENCYRGKVISILEIAPKIYDTIKEKYPDKKNIAFMKKLSSSTLYLKKLEYEGYNIDFVNVGDFNQEKIKKYDLIILEDKVQNDNVFNPQDVQIKYHLEGKNVIFDDGEHQNCYYIYSNELNNKPYIDDAIERVCFSYSFLLQNKNLKLDFEENIEIGELKHKANLFYFIRHIND